MSLVIKAVSGMRWTTLTMVITVAFNLGYTAVIARLLPPSAFGLIAMAQIAIRFLSYFAQLGISPALIQKPELSKRDIGAALSLSVVVNVTLFCLMWLLAPLAAALFDRTEVIPFLRALAASFLFSGFSVIFIGLLRRRLAFKQLAFVEISSYIFGYGFVGIIFALYDFGVWSLVLATLGQEMILLILSYAYARSRIAFVCSWKESRYFLHYGSKYSVIGFLEYIGGNVDSLLIGRWYGETMLGLYNRAQMLVRLPTHHVGNAISKVLFPVLSEAQADKQKMANAFLAGWVLIGSLATSISFSLIPAASDAVLTLLGEKWVATIPIVQIAALAVPFSFLTVLSGNVCDAQGILKPKLLIQIATLITLLVALSFLRDQGALGFAKVMVIVEAFRLALYTGLHFVLLRLTIADFLKVNAAVTLPASASAFGVWQIASFTHSYEFSAWISFFMELVGGALIFSISSLVAWCWLRNMRAFLTVKSQLPLLQRLDGLYYTVKVESKVES